VRFFEALEDYTKKKTLCAAEQQREDVALQREEWKQIQEIIDIKRLVFIDETWTKTNRRRQTAEKFCCRLPSAICRLCWGESFVSSAV
jgi:hypothetical protein